MHLDEASLRRPGFAGGVPVRLADGQEWTLPRPAIEYAPAFLPDGSVDVARLVTYGPEYEDLLERFLSTPEGTEQVRAVMGLAVFLLRINYDLDAKAMSRLLRWRADDEANAAMWQAIADVAAGIERNPPSPIGDASN